MTRGLEEALERREPTAKHVTVQAPHDHVFCAEHAKGGACYLINLKEMKKLMLKRREETRRWDFLSTFKPPQHLSIESGQIY